MKKAIGVLGVLCVAFAGGYFALGKWGIKHDTLNFFDAKRHRSVAVDLAVRRDYEMKAGAGYEKLPFAIISQGNTVRNTEYSFLANVFAARGYPDRKPSPTFFPEARFLIASQKSCP